MIVCKKIVCLALLIAAAVAWSGCAIMRGPVADPSMYYILDTTDYQPVAEGTAEEAALVALGRVRVARYLEEPGMAVRQRGHTVNYSRENRWAEPLDVSISRIITENLTREATVRQVVVFPAQHRDPDYDLLVNISRAEGVIPLTDRPHAVFRATWELRSGRAARLLASGSVQQDRLPWDGESYDQLAGSISDGVEELSRQVAEALLELME